jgi:hypothetical protein
MSSSSAERNKRKREILVELKQIEELEAAERKAEREKKEAELERKKGLISQWLQTLETDPRVFPSKRASLDYPMYYTMEYKVSTSKFSVQSVTKHSLDRESLLLPSIITSDDLKDLNCSYELFLTGSLFKHFSGSNGVSIASSNTLNLERYHSPSVYHMPEDDASINRLEAAQKLLQVMNEVQSDLQHIT